MHKFYVASNNVSIFCQINSFFCFYFLQPDWRWKECSL